MVSEPRWESRYRLFESGTSIIPDPFLELEQEVGHKPKGLWFTPGQDDWKEWCEENMPHWLEGKTLGWFDVDLSRMLVISEPGALLEFTARFLDSEMEKRMRLLGVRSIMSFNIDWRAVAEQYDGIEIAPYQWGLRLDERCHWYYTWDVASGCVWRRRSVRESR